MQKIDLAVWPRAELFRFFSAVSQPFYSVTFRVDVTNLHAYARAHGVSFYYALGYLVTDAVNAVENFRYTIRSGEVWLLDERVPSFTDLKPGSQQFHIVTLPKEGDLDSFCRTTRAKSEAQQTFLDQSGELDDLIYFSCTPWFDLTGCTNENILDLVKYVQIGMPIIILPSERDQAVNAQEGCRTGYFNTGVAPLPGANTGTLRKPEENKEKENPEVEEAERQEKDTIPAEPEKQKEESPEEEPEETLVD